MVVSLITDDVAPEVRNLVFIRMKGDGKYDSSHGKKSGARFGRSYSIGESVPVWGDVSFGIEAYDRMTGTTNKYGVHQVDLYIDDSLFFRPISIVIRLTRLVILIALPKKE